MTESAFRRAPPRRAPRPGPGIRYCAPSLNVVNACDDRQDRQAHLEGHRAAGQQHGATTLRLDRSHRDGGRWRETKREEMRERATRSVLVAFISAEATIDST